MILAAAFGCRAIKQPRGMSAGADAPRAPPQHEPPESVVARRDVPAAVCKMQPGQRVVLSSRNRFWRLVCQTPTSYAVTCSLANATKRDYSVAGAVFGSGVRVVFGSPPHPEIRELLVHVSNQILPLRATCERMVSCIRDRPCRFSEPSAERKQSAGPLIFESVRVGVPLAFAHDNAAFVSQTTAGMNADLGQSRPAKRSTRKIQRQLVNEMTYLAGLFCAAARDTTPYLYLAGQGFGIQIPESLATLCYREQPAKTHISLLLRQHSDQTELQRVNCFVRRFTPSTQFFKETQARLEPHGVVIATALLVVSGPRSNVFALVFAQQDRLDRKSLAKTQARMHADITAFHEQGRGRAHSHSSHTRALCMIPETCMPPV
jgi:hypothetical protein